MPKRRPVAGLGMGPMLVLLFLFVAALVSLASGRTLFQFGVRIGIVVAFVGVLYFVWYQLAIRNPMFRMGTGGESTIVLVIVGVAFLFVADPLATSLRLSLTPSPLSGLGVTTALSIGLGQSAIVSTVAAFIVLVILAYAVLRRRKKHR